MSPVRLLTLLSVLAGAGLLGGPVTTATASPRAIGATARACGQDEAGPATPTLVVARRAQPTGEVLVATTTRSVLLGPSGHTTSVPTSGPRPAPGQAWLTFCLRAGKGAVAPLLEVTPGRLTLALGARRVLRLRGLPAGRARGTGQAVLNAPARLVQLRVGLAHGTAALLVGGRRRATVSARRSAVLRVALGPGRRGAVIRLSAKGSKNGSPAPGRPGTSAPPGSGTTTPGATSPGGTTPVSAPPLPGPAPWPGNPFALTSVWNAPVAPVAALDPNSAVYVSDLQSMVAADKPWMNTTSYSTPVYVVGAGQATQHVTLDYYAPDLQAQFDAVPLPAGASPAAGNDAHLTVWQPSADKLWEFFRLHRGSGGWHAGWGGEMDDVSANPGYFTHVGQTTNWGATATGLPLLGGLVTLADLQRGVIDHALAIAIPQAAKGFWSWPAQRGDGTGVDGGGTTYIPEGTRFRLDPSVNVAALNLPPIDRMLALAAQQYGIVVRDQSGSVSFYGEDPTPTGSNPWPSAFGHQDPAAVLTKFPWADLQALRPPS